MSIRSVSRGDKHYLFNETRHSWSEALFETTSHHAAAANHRGRGAATFFSFKSVPLVLKQYHRGGLIGRLVARRYFYSGLENTRVWREFRLLDQLNRLGLPVPEVVAAEVRIRDRLFYHGRLITVEIANAKTLAEWIEQAALSEKIWESIGSTLRQFHDRAVYHDDLNANNIMLDLAAGVWLIDFDKGSIGQKRGDGWKPGNLKRLRRSLDKIKARAESLHFTDRNWSSLMNGYRDN